MLAIYATNHNLYKPRVRTNNNNQMFLFRTTDVWKSIPQTFRELNEYAFFKKKIEHYLPSEQLLSRPHLTYFCLNCLLLKLVLVTFLKFFVFYCN